jgi:predicted PurR-regulated permease PerM
MREARVRQAFLILLVVVISAAFLLMVRTFMLTVLMAAILAALTRPAYLRLVHLVGGWRPLAALVTIALLLLLVIAPLLAVLGVVAAEALRISDTLAPQLAALVNDPDAAGLRLRTLPGYAWIAPYEATILARTGELVGSAGSYVFDAVSAATRATATFVFLFVVMLYTLYFFLIDGDRLLRSVLSYVPLADDDASRMLRTFMSMTRATLKGTVLIAIVQGVLGGIALGVLGVPGAIFWATVMTLASIVPGVGSALVWVPAAIFLIATGQIWQGVALAAFGAVVIGSIDNVLRPRLVGRDTRMHELLIFFSTLGGIALFGVLGFLVGPILAALFTTVWDLFRTAFRAAPPAEA